MPVQPPSPDGLAFRACADLHPALPERLDALDRRPTRPDSPLTGAWGDPPVLLRCGVPLPAAYDPEGQIADVEGVGWLVEEHPGGYDGNVFTSVGRVALVEVRVPRAHGAGVDALVDLAGPLRARVPEAF